jgi:hypothetical protein
MSDDGAGYLLDIIEGEEEIRPNTRQNLASRSRRKEMNTPEEQDGGVQGKLSTTSNY